MRRLLQEKGTVMGHPLMPAAGHVCFLSEVFAWLRKDISLRS